MGIGAGVAAIAAALKALAGTALSFGIMEGIEQYKTWKISQNPDIATLQARANALIDAAAKKGERTLTQVQQKLDAIVRPFGLSDAVNQHITDARRRLTEKKALVNDQIDAISKKSAELSGLVTAHEMTSETGKLGTLGKVLRGKAEATSTELSQMAQGLDQIEQKV